MDVFKLNSLKGQLGDLLDDFYLFEQSQLRVQEELVHLELRNPTASDPHEQQFEFLLIQIGFKVLL